MSFAKALFKILPADRAMATLRAGEPGPAKAVAWVEAVETTAPAKAALWLYVDALEPAHLIVQDLDTATGAFLHAIVHRREGDYWNSKYWYARTHRHPVLSTIEEFHPPGFVDRVEAAEPENPEELVAIQRAEWQALFDYIVRKEM